MLYELVGYVGPAAETLAPAGAPAAPQETENLVQIVSLLEQKRVDEVFVLLKDAPNQEITGFLSACRRSRITVKVLPQPYELYVSRIRLTDLQGMPFLEMYDMRFSRAQVALKRTFDFVVAGLALLVLSPALLVAALGLRLRRHPVLRRERRIGQGGRSFYMYRFGGTDENPATGKRGWLVKYSLHEIPQLLNVLKGEMSLVGPRPEFPEIYKHYSEWHHRRLEVPAGITGLAQIHGVRGFQSVEEKIGYDLQYILEWSFLQDLLILVETIYALLSRVNPPIIEATVPSSSSNPEDPARQPSSEVTA